jgi:hypothetical protein
MHPHICVAVANLLRLAYGILGYTGLATSNPRAVSALREVWPQDFVFSSSASSSGSSSASSSASSSGSNQIVKFLWFYPPEGQAAQKLAAPERGGLKAAVMLSFSSINPNAAVTELFPVKLSQNAASDGMLLYTHKGLKKSTNFLADLVWYVSSSELLC